MVRVKRKVDPKAEIKWEETPEDGGNAFAMQKTLVYTNLTMT